MSVSPIVSKESFYESLDDEGEMHSKLLTRHNRPGHESSDDDSSSGSETDSTERANHSDHELASQLDTPVTCPTDSSTRPPYYRSLTNRNLSGLKDQSANVYSETIRDNPKREDEALSQSLGTKLQSLETKLRSLAVSGCPVCQPVKDLKVFIGKKGFMPTSGSEEAVGLDVYSSHSKDIGPGETVEIDTDIVVYTPSGYRTDIRERSGLSLKNLTVRAGLVDPDYEGTLRVIIQNTGREDYYIRRAKRVAQLVVSPSPRFRPLQVYQQKRGARGMGSSG